MKYTFANPRQTQKTEAKFMDVIKSQFTRVSPAKFAETIGIPMGWFVISHRWMPDKKQRRLSHACWFKIKSAHGEIYRILRFSANLPGSPSLEQGDIVLDWLGWIDLFDRAEEVEGPIELEISEAKWWNWQTLAVSHPDPSMKLAARIALLSFWLGILSFILSVASLFK
ncbi:MAG: hypothetical protein KGL10_00895 [Alphaproteobacteria bacterium]|nr:hypothetical protein [Alphaproteobacteria bacterium]